MKPILKWQYQQITKELLLLQGHLADATCPCESEGEACVRKHLLTLEALAAETMPIEDDASRGEKLAEFALEARDMRQTEEQNLCGKEPKYPHDPLEWSRKWRKEFEFMCLVCEAKSGTKSKANPEGDIMSQYSNPHQPKAKSVVCQAGKTRCEVHFVASKAMAPGSIRTIKPRPDVDVVIGCPKGKFSKGRCTVATKLVMMRLPKEEAKQYK
jgi:hypothetical protein